MSGEGEAIIALADRASAGMDVEPLRSIADVESLARLVFSDAKRRQLNALLIPLVRF